MKIIKISEKYEFDDEYDDIAHEYAKQIISKYLDDLNDQKTLQDAIYYFAKNDELEEYQIEQILYSANLIITKIENDINIILSTKKYNL